MLRELHISNLAVIADARVEFDAGLNCFTGATGAGKSLVIGAIELLLGLRGPQDMLRSGADEGRVSGLFEIPSKKILQSIETITDAPIASEGSELLVVRRLYASGRSSASLNGHPITQPMLRAVGELLVDIHGQHDQQFLLKPSNQIDVLDRFGDLLELREKFRAVHAELNDAKRQLEELRTGKRLRDQQLDFLRFQAEEIDRAELDAKEFLELEGRSSILTHVEKLRKDAGAAYAALYDAEGSLIERLRVVQAVLLELVVIDTQIKPIVESVTSGLIQLEEAAFDLNRYTQKLDLDPAELAEVNDRLNTLNRILRKYGTTVEDVLQFRAQIGIEISTLERSESDESTLTSRIAPLETKSNTLARQLSDRRKSASQKLSPLIEAQLTELGMEKAKFAIQFEALEEMNSSGADVVEFMVQTNPGLPSAPLRRVASGGEIGRIMLAIKSVLSAKAEPTDGAPSASVLVFDEIDSNIGGRLGSVIGSKLRQLARGHQVLCITHLPQIASYASRHLTVRKEQTGKQTSTTVRRVDGDERTQEISEMIGGKSVTEVTRAQALELLASAQSEQSTPPSKQSRQKRTAAK